MSEVRSVEMTSLKAACRVIRTNNMRNEQVYEKFGVVEEAGVTCGLVEWVKRITGTTRCRHKKQTRREDGQERV